jgi:DNA-directed RNA polymerase subunit beta'
MDEAERRAIAEAEAAELSGSSATDEATVTVDAGEGAATE